MAIDFPNSPSPGDLYTVNNRSWIYNGYGWERNPITGSGVIATQSYVDGYAQPLDPDLTSIANAGNGSVLAATTASFTTADETKLDGIETGATADQTAAEILTAIKTVDGDGTGLDADLLDGNHATAFATSAQGALASSALQNVVEDTTPQLGGALDVNGKEIVGAIDIHSSNNVILELGDAAGSNKVSVRDSGGAEVAYINSDGLIYGQNFTVVGNLTVNGTTATVNSTVVTVDDPVLTLGGDTAPSSDDNKDRGIEFRWHNGSTSKLGFFGFDDSIQKFVFIPDATNTNEVFSGAVGDLSVGAIASTGVVVTGDSTFNGNVEVNIDKTNFEYFRVYEGTNNIITANENGLGVKATPTNVDAASLTVLTGSSNIRGLKIIGASSQSANLTEWINISGTIVAQVDAAGEISSTGLDVTGNIIVSGTVDGRDIAADGAILDTAVTSSDVDDIVEISQSSYDALGSGRPAGRLYLVTS